MIEDLRLSWDEFKGKRPSHMRTADGQEKSIKDDNWVVLRLRFGNKFYAIPFLVVAEGSRTILGRSPLIDMFQVLFGYRRLDLLRGGIEPTAHDIEKKSHN